MEDKNSFSEFINNKISKLIAEKLSGKKYQNLGTSWLNLLLNNLPNDIKNNTLSLIYNFICNLGKDKKYLESPLKDIKIRIIEKILDIIYQKLFENDLINSFNVNDEINLFLSNPNIFIYNEILKELNDKFNKIQTNTPILNYYNKIKDVIPSKKDYLIQKTKDLNKQLIDDFRAQKEIEKNEELKYNIDSMKQNINDYMKIFNKLDNKKKIFYKKLKTDKKLIKYKIIYKN